MHLTKDYIYLRLRGLSSRPILFLLVPSIGRVSASQPCIWNVQVCVTSAPAQVAMVRNLPAANVSLNL